MNAGLTNLDTLKRHLLAGSMASQGAFDLQISTLGLGVAGLFDRFCNRELGYLADAEVVMSADRSHLVVPRYPLVEVASVSTKGWGETEWTAVDAEPQLFNATSGVVHFSGELGDCRSLVRVIYSGGYWWDSNEPQDGPGVCPEGATELPGDLRGAFLLQCQQVWATMDKMGVGVIGAEPGGQFLNTRLSYLDLLPLVKEMLRGFVRYQMS